MATIIIIMATLMVDTFIVVNLLVRLDGVENTDAYVRHPRKCPNEN